MKGDDETATYAMVPCRRQSQTPKFDGRGTGRRAKTGRVEMNSTVIHGWNMLAWRAGQECDTGSITSKGPLQSLKRMAFHSF
jgi:hypothetical protein